eukprot:6484342-Amphidinium_carterae.6
MKLPSRKEKKIQRRLSISSWSRAESFFAATFALSWRLGRCESSDTCMRPSIAVTSRVVDAYTTNFHSGSEALLGIWLREPFFSEFELVMDLGLRVWVPKVPSPSKPADAPSTGRTVDLQQWCTPALDPVRWDRVIVEFL